MKLNNMTKVNSTTRNESSFSSRPYSRQALISLLSANRPVLKS